MNRRVKAMVLAKPKNGNSSLKKIKKTSNKKWFYKGFDSTPKRFIYYIGGMLIFFGLGSFGYYRYVNQASAVFDTSLIAKYESQKGQTDPGAAWAKSSSGRIYAINNLGIQPSYIRQYSKKDVINMIKLEVTRQFNSLSNKYGSTLMQAQQAVLAYQELEDNTFLLVDSSNLARYEHDESGDCTQLMSLTNDKFTNMGYNKRAAASYDIRYNIYLGVQEFMDRFKQAQGTGSDRWHYTVGLVWWPSSPSRYWSRSGATTAWNMYYNQKNPYVETWNQGNPIYNKTLARGTTSVTLKAKVFDPQSKSVKLAIKLRKKVNGAWDCSTAKVSGTSTNYYIPASTWGTSGAIYSYTFSGLTPGTYQYSMMGKNSLGYWTDGASFCGDSVWADASLNTFTIPS